MEKADRLDALLPAAMARRAEDVGVQKASMDAPTIFALAVLAGAFIALGSVFATTALAGAETAPWGATRVLAGVTFSLGLILVVVGGAELFTGNNLVAMAWASGRLSAGALARNWGIVYAGNFLGATADRVLAVVPPISAFVAAGFEHSIANMYFVPLAIFIAALDGGFVAAHALEREAQALSWTAFLGGNLLPVTIGNMIGGTLLVGLMYWFVYLRRRLE